MYEIKYKREGDLILYDIHGILNYHDLDYSYFDESDIHENLYVIFGEFYYCGLVIDSQFVVQENVLNDILKICSPSINLVRNKIFYLNDVTKEAEKEIRELRFYVEHIFTLYDHDDEELDDDVFVFMMK